MIHENEIFTLKNVLNGRPKPIRPAPRPATTARIQILAPTPNQETGPDVTVQVKLFNAKEVPQVSGPIKPDEGSAS